MAAGVAAAALMTTAGGAAAITSPRDVASGQATGIFDSGEIRGIVVVRRVARRQARVVVALRGLPRNASLVADTEPCSTLPGRGDVVLGIIMANTEGDFHFRATRTRMQQRLRNVQTLRIYDRSKSGSASQVGCTPAVLSG
jgi:hypothetical protein